MLRETTIARLLLGLCAALLLCRPARAIELRSDLSLLGQVRDNYQTDKTDSPNIIYGDMGAAGLPFGSSFDTYFKLEHNFATGQGPTEFYAGYLQVPNAVTGVNFTLGRQFLSEVPGGTFVADAGKIRFDPGGPFAFTVFGGQPRYFEPTYSTEIQDQDEVIFGGSIRTTHLKNGYISLGYLQQERKIRPIPVPLFGASNQPTSRHELRQLISLSGAHRFMRLPGLPNVYGSASYDADRQNIDQATAGADVFLSQPRLLVNFESTYYKPQDQGRTVTADLDRREDAIFQLFSVSQMLQFRGGLRYFLSRSLSAYGDYSYQRYQQVAGSYVNGHVVHTGLQWLPGGDGLEIVHLEYYMLDSSGGNVNGVDGSYESRVYKRLLFRAKAGVAYYEKASHQHDTAVSSLLGLGYAIAPGLTGELDFEANRNQFLNEDFRFGFFINYRFRHATDAAKPPSREVS